eukprot:scaffold108644_cov39-Phaeocystis_antarctica.AAC.1
MRTACAPHAHGMRTARAPHAHRMRTACAPHAHGAGDSADLVQLHAQSLKCEALHVNGTPPTARHGHAAAVVGGLSFRLVVSGGVNKLGVLSDLHVLDLA